jgi:hypothetical protein
VLGAISTLVTAAFRSDRPQFDHHVDREAVRAQHRLGAAICARSEQFERPAAGRA